MINHQIELYSGIVTHYTKTNPSENLKAYHTNIQLWQEIRNSIEDFTSVHLGEVRKNARFLALGKRNEEALISILPNEILVQIASLTGLPEVSNQANYRAAFQFFDRPINRTTASVISENLGPLSINCSKP